MEIHPRSMKSVEHAVFICTAFGPRQNSIRKKKAQREELKNSIRKKKAQREVLPVGIRRIRVIRGDKGDKGDKGG